MDNSTLVSLAEAGLRLILGWRMLISGLSNVRRWPNPVNTASILFPKGAPFFGFVATFLMVVGGFGLGAGIQTSISAVMIIIFLIPTFALHFHWLKVLPTMVPVVMASLKDEKAQNYFRSFDRQAYHAHEVGLRDNLVFVAAACYFAVRGSAGFGVDNWLSGWVVRLF
ncbi:MAG: DoxX family protein [Deltaproteobacteria bacterium]|nr:DoxX family protein [Deltaproteobacteria bacterium]